MTIKVDHVAIDSMAQDIKAAVQKISSQLDQMEQEIIKEAGGDANWRGSSRAAFDQSRSQWEGALAEMIQLLNTTGTKVMDANEAMHNADKRGADSLTI
jgi:6 kDa early secretory antigenic target